MKWFYGNGIAEIGGEKNLQLVCGNAIAEIGDKIYGNCGNVIVENGRKKQKIVVGALSDITKVEVESSCK